MVQWIILQYIINKIEEFFTQLSILWLNFHHHTNYKHQFYILLKFIHVWLLMPWTLTSICMHETAAEKTDNNVFCKYHSNDKHIIHTHSKHSQVNVRKAVAQDVHDTHANCLVEKNQKKGKYANTQNWFDSRVETGIKEDIISLEVRKAICLCRDVFTERDMRSLRITLVQRFFSHSYLLLLRVYVFSLRSSLFIQFIYRKLMDSIHFSLAFHKHTMSWWHWKFSGLVFPFILLAICLMHHVYSNANRKCGRRNVPFLAYKKHTHIRVRRSNFNPNK